MKYRYLSLFVLLISTLSFGQESLEAIQFQPRGKRKMVLKSAANTLDSSFIYTYDTIQLPIFDDFSKSKFQDHSATPGAPNVSEELFYKLTDAGAVPLPVTAVYTSAVTKRRTTENGATTDADLTPITVLVADFSAYPVAYSTVQAYPPYYIYDTLDFVNEPDTVYVANPEYTQDSARVFTAALSDPNAIWIDQYVFHNYTHALDPWSLGVATFDGLDETGYPYHFGTTMTGRADVLTS
jgi:hypothetical protein